uniref:Uncharacterized protein n=1 Tax=Peronospora matthiolae TaxID=2874970 RepID=A0AAV1TVA3_9STRA
MSTSTPTCHSNRPSALVTPANTDVTATIQHPGPSDGHFTSPSFVSPAPTNGCKPQDALTLCDQLSLKTTKLKLPQVQVDAATTLQHQVTFSANHHATRVGVLKKPTRVLEDISNTTRRDSWRHDVTTKRKLAFCTPIKPLGQETRPVGYTSCPTLTRSSDTIVTTSTATTPSLITYRTVTATQVQAPATQDQAPAAQVQAPATQDQAPATQDQSPGAQDQAPAAQDPALAPVVASPVPSQASNAVQSRCPVSLKAQEYHFSVSSTVSSVAIAPDGSFLVAGFYNGMVYLYPLTTASLSFQRGVLLDQILPRGMYTQIMVTVSIPTDGRFIFAGVYRGSTDIRAIEVDSIELPSRTEDLFQERGTVRTSHTKDTSMTLLSADDSDESDRDGDFLTDVFRSPTAHVVAHTFSDAKLKGFAAAKSLYHETSGKMEYRLLCGIGIKNVHMWRFYQKKNMGGADLKWSWECVFDKQTNGISLEFISFHPTIANQFISKSEHQNVRIWHLKEDYDAVVDSVTIQKQSHTDVKQTLDSVAVFGDFAYGGSESLAVIDLQAAVRMDLDLPLSRKEQRAQREALVNLRNANSLRAWNPRGSRRRGAEDTSGQRHMRTVSKIAGQDASPFTVGMCSDGSVFIHQPSKETGLATPLNYVEGYEQFFVDPSLDFQAQFSDLTRVNTSGLLAVLPFPEMEKQKWMVVAANQNQLLVQTLDAFLHRNERNKECFEVKRDSGELIRDLGGAESFSDSSSSSDSDISAENAAKEKHRRQKKLNMALKRSRQDFMLKRQEAGQNEVVERKPKRNRHESKEFNFREENAVKPRAKRKTSLSVDSGSQETVDNKQLVLTGFRGKVGKRTTPVATPSYSTPRDGDKLWTSAASPVVSISSSSDSSHPNTPEQPGLSRLEQKLLGLRRLEKTMPCLATAKSRQDNLRPLAESAAHTTSATTSLSSSRIQAEAMAMNVISERKAMRRVRAQALFTDDERIEGGVIEDNCEVARTEMKDAEKGSLSSKRSTGAVVSNKQAYIGSSKSARLQAETQDSSTGEEKEPIEADIEATKSGREKDVELEEELEQLERYEPEFMLVPLVSDKGSLLAATMYQYADPASRSCNGSKMSSIADVDVETDREVAATEQTNLLMQFSRQNERLRMNFFTERERIYKLPDCSCASPDPSKKLSSVSTSGMNWRRKVAYDFHKRKQLKRRHKKQLTMKLQQLHATYALQVQELFAMQQMEANAYRARQQFQHLYVQLRRQTGKIDSVPLSSAPAAADPLKYSAMPDHLSDARFPYSTLLSKMGS